MTLGFARFQTSATKYMRTALFWATTQREVVIPHRRFGTTYRSHLRGPIIQILDPWKLDRKFVPKRRWGITTKGNVTAQKRAILFSLDFRLLINGKPNKERPVFVKNTTSAAIDIRVFDKIHLTPPRPLLWVLQVSVRAVLVSCILLSKGRCTCHQVLH